jgi:hypothetical protein
VVEILALLALFTHNNLFWVAAILIAAFRVPDFLTPLNSIAESLKAANLRSGANPLVSEEPEGKGVSEMGDAPKRGHED